jgi:hypothetical protein
LDAFRPVASSPLRAVIEGSVRKSSLCRSVPDPDQTFVQ